MTIEIVARPNTTASGSWRYVGEPGICINVGDAGWVAYVRVAGGKMTEDELLAEIEALRAENAWLKTRVSELMAQAAKGDATIVSMLEIYPDLANAPVIAAALTARKAE